ncbi:MAG: hypothetical protein ABIS24_04080 [Candidatus Saccharimonadales bacterium]
MKEWSTKSIHPSSNTTDFFDWYFSESGKSTFYAGRLSLEEQFPLYLYCEDNLQPSQTGNHIYLGRQIYAELGQTTHGILLSRELIDIEINEENARGLVLGALCEIEFIVDVLICYLEDVFKIRGQYSRIAPDWNEGSKYSTLRKRLTVLKAEGLISKKTFDVLYQAKLIRDTLAHKFIPREFGIPDGILKRYGGKNGISHLSATRDCINLSWVQILHDLNHIQDDLITDSLIGKEWLITKDI